MKKKRSHWLIWALVGLLVGCDNPTNQRTGMLQAPDDPRPIAVPEKPRIEEFGPRLVSWLLDLAPSLIAEKPQLFLNKRKPFSTFLGRCGQLAVYDSDLQDIVLYPGAGNGLFFVSEVSPNRFFFIRNFKVWLYDAVKETTTLLSGKIPEGQVLIAAPDAYSSVYCLVALSPLGGNRKLIRIRAAYPGLVPILIDRIASASFTLASGSFILPDVPDCSWPPLIRAEEMCAVNEVGDQHGGLQAFFPTARGIPLVFTTMDGGLYLYSSCPSCVCKLETNGRRAAFPTIDAILERHVAWEDRDSKQIFVLDLLTGKNDPVPFANLFVTRGPALVDVVPAFYKVDPFHLYVFSILADQTFRVFHYDLQTEEILNLTLINDLVTDLASESSEVPDAMFQELFEDQYATGSI